MKTKSHSSKWAMALCALAVFSLTAQAAIQPGPAPGPSVPPPTDVKTGKLQPFPAIQPPVQIGTFNGSVME
ncbi:MAG: hypothetical protein ACJ8M4_06070 [Chthoniobacterales bacterium]